MYIALLIVVGFGFLVFVHELGHFLVAKAFGIKVHDFFLGFGPKLYKKKVGETTYGVAAIPLGGYVKLSGMEEEGELSPEDEARSFRAQARWKRVLVILAGPVSNIVFAIPLFMIVIMNTPPVTGVSMELAAVAKGSPAAKVGIKVGDVVTSIDGNPVKTFPVLQKRLAVAQKSGDGVTVIEVRRGDESKEFTVRLRKPDTKKGAEPTPPLGIQAKATYGSPPGPVEAAGASVKMTWDVSRTIAGAFVGLFTGGTKMKEFTESSAGPIGIVSILGEGASRGILDFIWLIAIIGPNLAIVNLFPMLPLDGGRIVLILYEAVRRKRATQKRIMQFQLVGVALILFLVVTLTTSDLGKLFRGESFLGG